MFYQKKDNEISINEVVLTYLIENTIEEFRKNSYQKKTHDNLINAINSIVKKPYFETTWLLQSHKTIYETGALESISLIKEPNLDNMDNFLLKYYPNVSYLQYKKLEQYTLYDEENVHDYYSNTKEGIKRIYLDDFSRFLMEYKLEQNCTMMNLKEVENYIKDTYNKEWFNKQFVSIEPNKTKKR